ncbi:MAG: Crp/Fnr family transcriptional regulator [Saprospiraceae bacterium]|nr:Crp/Fnr family transcriptional regulator [Saprospiraceae bacterium]
MEQSNFWYLQNIDVTGIFCPDKMMSNPEKHQEKVFKRGEYIYLPEEHSDKIYFLLRGRVKIGSFGDDDKEIIKAILGKGEVFGELALVEEGKRRDFAIAMEETEVCIIQKDDINRLFKERSPLQGFFLNLFGRRILQMESRLEGMVFKNSRSRIIDFLVELAAKRGERVGFETVVRKFLTHQEIANITATSRQTVTTVLNELRSKEIIKFDRRRLLIRDRERLAAEVGTGS